MSASRSAPPDPARSAALELLRRERRFLLCGHERPDGDCLGSQVALARVLATLGKDVRVLNPDPIDRRYEHLASAVRFETHRGGPLPEHDVAVLLDFHEPARAGELGRAIAAGAARKLVVDHHPHSGPAWWDAAYVDVGAAATGLLVRRIARELGVPLDSAAAEGVFTALVTDTGWFRYSNADVETLAVASELVAAGVEPARTYDALFQRRGAEHPILTGRVLASTRYHAGGKLAVAAIALDEGGAEVDVDEALDVLRSVGAVEVVLVLRETESGAIRLSARSKGEYDVRELAAELGGGGHARAAGATLAGPLGAAVAGAVSAALARFPATASAASSSACREGARR